MGALADHIHRTECCGLACASLGLGLGLGVRVRVRIRVRVKVRVGTTALHQTGTVQLRHLCNDTAHV